MYHMGCLLVFHFAVCLFNCSGGVLVLSLFSTLPQRMPLRTRIPFPVLEISKALRALSQDLSGFSGTHAFSGIRSCRSPTRQVVDRDALLLYSVHFVLGHKL